LLLIPRFSPLAAKIKNKTGISINVTVQDFPLPSNPPAAIVRVPVGNITNVGEKKKKLEVERLAVVLRLPPPFFKPTRN
jgi:hypothetical protein